MSDDDDDYYEAMFDYYDNDQDDGWPYSDDDGFIECKPLGVLWRTLRTDRHQGRPGRSPLG